MFDTTTSPYAGLTADQVQQLLNTALSAPPVQLPSLQRAPSDGTRPGVLGLLGEALAGGQSPLYRLSGQQEDLAGSRALLNAGINMMLASGPNRVRTPLSSVVAAGLQGAGQSMDTSQQLAYTQAGQQFAQQQQLAQLGLEQQKQKLATLGAVLPLLRLQQAYAQASPFGTQPGTTATATTPPPSYGGTALPKMPPEYDAYFQEASQRYGVPVEVLKAQAAQESGFDPNTVGKAGEIGIMQVKPSTAASPGFGISGISDPANALRNPRTNIMMGAAYLKARAGNLDLSTPAGQAAALTAYNGGGDPQYAQHVFRYMPKPAAPAGVQVAGPASTAIPRLTTPPAPPPATTDLVGHRPLPPTGPGTPVVTPASLANTPVPAPAPSGTTPPPAPPAPATAPATPPPKVTPYGAVPDAALPDAQLSREQYFARHYVEPQFATVTTDPQALADRTTALNDARQAMTAAERDYQLQLGTPNADAALKQRNAAQERFQQAQQNYNQLIQQAQSETAKNRQQAMDQQTTQLSTAFTAQQQRTADVALENLRSQHKLAEINATSDAQAAGKALETINASTAGAQDVVNQAEMARQLSQAAGTPDFLSLWPKVADNLVRANLLSHDEVNQLGAQRALDAVTNKLILALKSQAGFSRFTNQDLTFLQNTAPGSFTPVQLRTGMLAAIQTAAQRQLQYGQLVNSMHASGMPVWQAQQEADKQLGSIIPNTPSFDNVADPQAKLDAQGQWVTQNVPTGSFYLKPNGKLGIRGQAAAQ